MSDMKIVTPRRIRELPEDLTDDLTSELAQSVVKQQAAELVELRARVEALELELETRTDQLAERAGDLERFCAAHLNISVEAFRRGRWEV